MQRVMLFHKVMEVLKTEGFEGILFHIFLKMEKYTMRKKVAVRKFDITPVNYCDTVDAYDTIVFEQEKEPLVSIVIPVYNQFAHTYNCLSHIKKYADNIRYEIILSDDCSSDLTKVAEYVIKGIKIIHNTSNTQYLKNCNEACKHARGKYILLLNNDVQVQDGWLSSLTNLLENNSKIGIAGSKLIYPDGLVQEAGGIVWRDGSVLQFGNRRRPEEFLLNNLRKTDYVSAASILVNNRLWREIGGFDNRFFPAYYEDVDLAFEVRKRGYDVVFQPKSEAIHFEGVSEGLNKKRYEQIEKNKKIFLEKWGVTLARNHYSKLGYLKLVKKMKHDLKQK